jgi:hypothetical protein
MAATASAAAAPRPAPAEICIADERLRRDPMPSSSAIAAIAPPPRRWWRSRPAVTAMFHAVLSSRSVPPAASAPPPPEDDGRARGHHRACIASAFASAKRPAAMRLASVPADGSVDPPSSASTVCARFIAALTSASAAGERRRQIVGDGDPFA